MRVQPDAGIGEFGHVDRPHRHQSRPHSSPYQSGIRICHGDTIMDPKLPVLNYGQTFQRDGFTCKSEPSGVTCFNADRHGFSISRNTQSVF